jgi:hypothetical protein
MVDDLCPMALNVFLHPGFIKLLQFYPQTFVNRIEQPDDLEKENEGFPNSPGFKGLKLSAIRSKLSIQMMNFNT